MPKLAARTIPRNRPAVSDSVGPNHDGTRPPDRHTKGAGLTMKRSIWLFLLLFAGLWGQPASAQGLLGNLLSNLGNTVSNLTAPQPGVIVRTNLGLGGLQNVCLLNGCAVVSNLDGSQGMVCLVKPTQQGLVPDVLAAV